MNLLDQLKEYKPFNSQEERDQKQFIDFLLNNTNAYKRENEKGHVTSSCWIMNKERNKVLMCYHNIYDSYSWLGGHNDGDIDCLNVSLKELKEESGLNEIKLIYNGIYSIEILSVKKHFKNNKKVKEHKHYNITYLFECDENETLKIKSDENKDLKWFFIDELEKYIKEKGMYNKVYLKLIKKYKKTVNN